MAARSRTTASMRAASGRLLDGASGMTRSARMLSRTVTNRDWTSRKCWKTERTDTSARRATPTTVGASLVSAIISLAASMILRRVSAARRLRPSVRTTVPVSDASSFARDMTAASTIIPLSRSIERRATGNKLAPAEGSASNRGRVRHEQGKDGRTAMNTSHANSPRAILWDFGGVILSSPFDAFRSYEREAGLPEDFIRMLNARNPDTNAWAKMERSEVSLAEFVALFEAEAAAQGHKLDGWRILQLLSGDIRPQMVEALRRCKQSFRIACITNNMKHGEGPGMSRTPEKAQAIAEIMTLFEHVVESSKLGWRKPDPRIYRHACDLLGVAPEHCIYLDDLGINLKPARALGMRTIKVGDPDKAIAELEAMIGVPLRDGR